MGIDSATEPRLSPHTQPRRPHKSVNTLVAEEGSWPQLSYSLLKTKVEKSALRRLKFDRVSVAAPGLWCDGVSERDSPLHP